MSGIYTNPIDSRNEEILESTIENEPYTEEPQSRIEELLLELKTEINRTFTAKRALVSDEDGKASTSDVTDTELGYLSGVTSPIQSQINAKANESELDATPVSVSGNPITITGAANIPCESLSMTIEPTQSGSGTPSPSNARPISGLTEATVKSSVQNLCPVPKSSFTASYTWCSLDGGNAPSATSGTPIQLLAGNYVVALTSAVNMSYCQILDSNSNVYLAASNGGSFTLESDKTLYIRVKAPTLYQAVSFETFVGTVLPNTATITFGETVYGGSVDFNTGIVTVTHANIASYNGETINEPWLSSMDEYASGTTPTTGAQVVYPLTTPTTLTLTPAQLTILKENNTVSGNGATISLSYQKDNLVGDLKKWVLDHIPSA